MNILYGVQATGNGHISRARAMAKAFEDQDCNVDFLFSGRPQDKYFSMEAFGDYQTYQGLTFTTQKGGVKYLRSAWNNNLLQFYNDVTQLDLSTYDLVINDFEPVSAWAARKHNIPCIGISHQSAFRYDVPKKGGRWLDQLLIDHFAPADIHIGLHWYHFDQPILPPIVHTHFSQHPPSQDFVLVYLPFEELEDVSDFLYHAINQTFVCYHPEIIEESIIENIHFKPLSHCYFQQDLHQCRGVISNGGFELPSEALTLGKKLLLKALTGQFEQESNVATLEVLGLAQSMDFLNPSVLRSWLDEPQADHITYPDVAAHLVEWLLQGKWEKQDVLRKVLWSKVDFPSYSTAHE